ncbi:MAG TPA: glycosyltransferase family 2 protein [Deltaproteobacteria bacterium]|nr:glycosyltransferase family 2 protein [Deltaproteobacteria bacterium]HQB39844.1 glycosyltransferase family 2 protein [Deltaproteobacteria bacterium]
MEHLLLKQALIILVNWNGWRDTLECLESLQLLDYPDFRVVVCDNASNDGSVNMIREWAAGNHLSFMELPRHEAEELSECNDLPWLTLIRIDENLGFAGGNNVGIRFGLSRAFDYFWLLNNDTVVEPGALKYLVQRMLEKPTIGICGSTIRLYENREKVQALGGGRYLQWLGLPWHYGRYFKADSVETVMQSVAEARMNYVEGASMLVSRRFVDTVGLLCEDYFLFLEEADWAVRAKAYFSLGYAPRSVVYHKIGASIGTCSNPLKKSYLCDFYNIRNRILFAKRYYPATLPTVYLVLFGEAFLRVLLGKWGRAQMILKQMMSCGNYEGIVK